MKILYIITKFPITGGSSILVQGLSQTLTKLGHKAIIATSDLPARLNIKSTMKYEIKRIPFFAYNFFFNSIYKKKKGTFLERAVNGIENLIINRINKFARKYSLALLWGLSMDCFGWKLLLRMIFTKKKDIDIIFTTPIPHSCITASLITGKIKKIPVAIVPAYHYNVNSYTRNDKLWSNILKRFEIILPHTIAELNYLSHFGVPRKIMKKVGVGVNFNQINGAGKGNWRNKLDIPQDKFSILYLNSSIKDPYKGVNTVIKAAIHLPSVHFVFVGRKKKDWEDLKDKYNLHKAKNISYIEFVSKNEKHQLFNFVDLIVKPSINESFGIVLFEGLCAGKPIIVSNIAPMVELSEGVGFCIPFNDVKSLIEKINILKNNNDLYIKFSHNALNKARSYSWKNIAHKVENIFKRVIEIKK